MSADTDLGAAAPAPDQSRVHGFHGDYGWDGVERLPYKATEDAPFRDVARQVLASAPDLAAELRYFEVGPGGHTTLERHGHRHAVLVLRGRGRCLVGDAVSPIAPYDLVQISPWTWHQFRADPDRPLGFLCLVNAERDRPQLPTADQMAALKRTPAVAAFLDGGSTAARPKD